MKTCVLLDDTTINDLNYKVMSELNLLTQSSLNDCFVFSQNVSSKVIKNYFAIISMVEICNFSDGLAIATNIDTAEILLKNVIPSTIKVYYVWKLEWLYNVFDYNKIYSIINNPELVVIARSDDHAKLLENIFDKKPDFIIEDFCLEEIWNSLSKIKKN